VQSAAQSTGSEVEERGFRASWGEEDKDDSENEDA